ncbi:hypothetical protein [Algisphaera agarilytica]|uniref:PEP-CTERM protein-sorting domain-containing protein n=1 Tax=Algisphaera agarilytica TaxID=1385975 RepID=A0A7X0H8V1_9BACT|nr:hypothetical protein [Algisphaera agarilytica]MBB6431278.1 hypothetical protein [Algisphaera agarilytica]
MKPRRWLVFAYAIVLTAAGSPASAMSIAGYTVTTYQFPGAPITGFRDINAAGDVVGYYQTDAADFNTANALRIVGGVPETINPPTSLTDRRAFGNNDAGTVVGSFNNSGSHGFVLTGPTFTTYDAPGTTQGTTIRGLNNPGDFVGEYDDAGGVQRGFVQLSPSSSGTFQTVTVPGAVSTTVRAINDAGRIAGFYADATGALHGYVSHDGLAFTTIDHPDPAAVSTLVGGINNDGVLVGAWLAALGSPESQPARGFIRDATGTFLPFDLIGATSTIPIGLNDLGQIVGEAVAPDGTHYGFIATPIPEPTTASVFALMTLLITRRSV